MKNPIERRLARIHELWSEHADDPATRLIEWVGPADDLRMVELYFELQNEDGGQVPDLILRFDTPFESVKTFGDALAKALREEYERSSEGLAEDNLSVWAPVVQLDPATSRPHDTLIVTLESFCDQFGAMFQRLALVLTPDAVSDIAAFQDWLVQAVSGPLPAPVVFVLLGPPEGGLCLSEAQCKELPAAIVPLQLDMSGAVEELAKSEGAEGPGKDFRLQFLAIGSAGKAKNPRAARRAAREARRIARAQKWPDQEVVVHLSLGSALLASNTPKDAAKVYARAVALSQHLMENKHPGGQALVLTSLMSEGAAQFTAQDYREAARIYQNAGRFAQDVEDLPAAIDAWRMASYCFSELENFESAWECGQIMLSVGEAVEPADRTATTLLHGGEMLLGFLEDRSAEQKRMLELDAQMSHLLQENWPGIREGATS